MRTVGEMFERNALSFGDREAFIYGGLRFTHLSFYEHARCLASAFYRLGLRRQERVAILAMNGAEIYLTYAAAEVAGFIAVPINFRLAAPEVASQLRDCDAKLFLYEAQYAGLVAKIRADFPAIRQFIEIGSATGSDPTYEQVMASGDVSGPPIVARPNDYAWLLYTSGTTGRPKGVPWRQFKVVESARACAHQSEMSGESRVLQTTPAFHVGGKGYVLAASWEGACTVLHRAFDARALLDTIQKERISHTFMVAAMVQALLSVPRVESYDLSSIRQIFSAAAPIPVPLLQHAIRLLGPVFSIQYGATELGAIAGLPKWQVNPSGSAEDIRRLGSVGRVAGEVEMRLLDDQDQPVASGTPGEVCVRSATMLDGYWNDSGTTIEAIRDGWYHTGDIGVLDQEGYLYLVDRKKDMIISGGENIYSREVEEALARHPAVQDAAVIGVPDPKWVETVKAVVALRPDKTVDAQGLIEHCKTLIASYKCPKSVEFVAELPRLATGKIDKPTLRTRYRQVIA